MKERKVLTVLIVTLFLFHSAQALSSGRNEATEERLNLKFFLKAVQDFKNTLISPLTWEARDFLTLSTIVGTGLLLYTVDQEVQDLVQERRTQFSNSFSGFFNTFGDKYFLLAFLTALYSAGEHLGERSLRKTALLSFEGIITSGIIVTGLKIFLGRARPRTGKRADTFHLFSKKPQFYSMPSGHASSAFALATTIAEQSSSTFIDVLAYTCASFVALSRVHENAHWVSDVFIGSAIGYFVAKKICALNRQEREKKVAIIFNWHYGGYSLTLSYFF
ncbi:MAG: phosphatase PAP2 family protein [Candidatus Aminicenantales bacterium]